MASAPTGRPYRSRRIIDHPSSSSALRGKKKQRCDLEFASSSLSNMNNQDFCMPMHSNERPQSRRVRRYRCRDPLIPAAAVGQPLPIAPRPLAPPNFCEFCAAKKFEGEPPSFCCSKGTVWVATNPLPSELLRLFTSKDEDALHFQTYCRLYNNLFAFSSLVGLIDTKTHKGIYVFRLHGQLYHFLPNLIPENSHPKFLQLYFYEAQFERQNRCSFFEELRPDIIAILMAVMENNPYAKFFKRLREKPIDEQTTIHINKNAVLDQRVYNAPTSDEVAAIWSNWSAEQDCGGPYVVVTGKSDKVHRIHHYYGCYDPLQYPLLFPLGDNGWHPGITKVTQKSGTHVATNNTADPVHYVSNADELIEAENSQAKTCNRKHVSCREYYAFLLQIRVGNRLLLTGRLLLQFIVDLYVKLENSRLDFFRNNQPRIRADLYQGLVDAVISGELQGVNAGRRIILPPSFIGGPRDMRRRYLNAMALVQKFGKPDIFATMTCNPNWPEIRAELEEGEKAQNRPDLIARIFQSKLRLARQEIMEKKIFGEVAALIYVVEFQKRGLPHAHFLIILQPAYKIKSPEQFDTFVSAEIPPATKPNLRAIVLNHMMHGPCGQANPKCPCMKQSEGRFFCKSRYPRNFAEHTTNKDDGYPIYRRRDTGEKVSVRRHEMDNRWVIPYNPYLLALFDCHFNVEICSTIQAVKYLYKYVYKGHDRISFNIGQANNGEPIDEIENYQSGRWVSPPEAAWRIFGFDLYEMYPPVMPLQIHCENMQNVSFNAAENLANVVSDEWRSQTPLTEFFKVNREHPEAKFLYSEFPEFFVWNTKAKTWVERKKQRMIGRLTFVGPSETDRFYLRLLLAHVRGPKSFSDLKTVDGYEHSTFQEACIQRGLVEECGVSERCLEEAARVEMPAALRSLFVTILIFCHPPNPSQLWEKYYKALSEDFRHLYPDSESTVVALTAEKVEYQLECMGRQLADFGLEHLKHVQHQSLRLTRDVRDAYDAPVADEYVRARKQLNIKQREAYKAIIHHVKLGLPGVFFVDGPGGTGKTFLYGALYAKVRQMDKIVLPTASSGIAAGCLPNGRTAHSRFKLPLDHNKSLTCDVPKQGSLAKLLREACMIIWDEAPMAHKANIHALDSLLRDVCSSSTVFGGKIVVFGGDFRQVLPVLPQKTQIEAVEASLVSSYLWPEFKRFHLDENMRAKEDPQFASFLLDLGNGKFQEDEHAFINLPPTITAPLTDEKESIEQLIDILFPKRINNAFGADNFNDRAILTTTNDEVDALNTAFIEKFQGEPFVYTSFDSFLDDQCHIYPAEFLHTLCPSGMSPYQLILKRDCPVILLRNIDPSSGLCNGTRLTCKEFFPSMLLCEISGGSFKGNKVMLPRINLRPSTSSNFPFQFERKQFPIKLCFAMTINKSQGQTLTEVGIYLQQPCFSHGQLYVALSRAKKATKVKVLLRHSSDSRFGSVKNVVSFEVLSRAGII